MAVSLRNVVSYEVPANGMDIALVLFFDCSDTDTNYTYITNPNQEEVQ
jgi:hypothetical protein